MAVLGGLFIVGYLKNGLSLEEIQFNGISGENGPASAIASPNDPSCVILGYHATLGVIRTVMGREKLLAIIQSTICPEVNSNAR
jgi:hypothetical protein